MQKKTALILVGFGCGGMLILAIALSVGGYYAYRYFAESLEAAVAQHPTVVQVLGDIESCEMDLIASSEAPGDETFAFNVRGTKGSGVVIADITFLDDGSTMFSSGTLTLANGTVHELEARMSDDPDEASGDEMDKGDTDPAAIGDAESGETGTATQPTTPPKD